jgi:HD-like signal output (HDOD) protein
MGVISIKDLKADMVLSGDIKDCRGRLLISKGTVLNEKYLKICRMWGVVEADVQGISPEEIYASAINNFDAATIAAAEKIVQDRFCHNDMGHPAIRELVRLCTLWVAAGKVSYQAAEPDDDAGITHLHREELERIRKNIPLNVNTAQYIGDATKLSTLPAIYRQILDAISKPSSSAYDIEKVIRTDTNLAARVLKIVNSAFYGYPSKIDTLSHAVNIIGTKQLSTLAMGINITCVFKNIPSEIINMKMFWKHSILCGICARLIAGYKNIQNTERMFVAGLLHDIGRLVLYNYLPIESVFAATVAKSKHSLLTVAERELFNFDHATIGGDLLNKWQMSLSLEDCIRHHHDPERSRNRGESSIIHLADIMANVMGIGSSGERLIPPLSQEAWVQLGITPNTLSVTMEQAEQQLEDVFELIYTHEQSH